MGTHVGCHVAGRLVGGGPTDIVGPLLDIRGGNALALNRPPIYTRYFPLFSPCGTMFPHGLTFCRRRGRMAGVGFDQDSGDRVDPNPRDH